ncbi:EKC/KEOPS complex subunit TPRKB [Nilaparvata lugens]|uniref:EKC/KEOPS complex subunit TPRKB n=1 Tax=Nilaparvata lugens TaxID=108931 RepID=UPI00193CDAF0|nr:EKC/KEOPS complex subunit TPRKB [Nilaparvata lugens]
MTLFETKRENEMISYDLEFDFKMHVKLASNVKNSKEISERLKSGNLNCALIRPHLVLDPFQIAVAANKAVYNMKMSNLVTKNINSEIIFNLGITRNISASFKDFGIRIDDDNFLVVIIGDEQTAEDIWRLIECSYAFPSSIKLRDYNDENAISKYYKISENELNASDLLSSVVSRIAIKGI